MNITFDVNEKLLLCKKSEAPGLFRPGLKKTEKCFSLMTYPLWSRGWDLLLLWPVGLGASEGCQSKTGMSKNRNCKTTIKISRPLFLQVPYDQWGWDVLQVPSTLDCPNASITLAVGLGDPVSPSRENVEGNRLMREILKDNVPVLPSARFMH